MSRAGILLILFGCLLAGRVAWDQARHATFAPLPLRVPFSEFGARVLSNGMRAEDRPLETRVEEVARVDDYINRWYSDGRRSLWFWVGFVSGWRPEAVHYPDVCFPTQGMSLIAQRTVELDLSPAPSPAPFHEYEWLDEFNRRTYTLSTFFYRGRFAPFDPESLQLRLERSLGIRYFAMITVSGPFQGELLETRAFYADVLRETIPQLIEHLPAEEPETK
ncbi:MAG TPA: exosortase-associated EpsI family protein [Planctomycetota bacterium]|nr:exosortase-associated EpsI family protein [Planctomycetota bacterium]